MATHYFDMTITNLDSNKHVSGLNWRHENALFNRALDEINDMDLFITNQENQLSGAQLRLATWLYHNQALVFGHRLITVDLDDEEKQSLGSDFQLLNNSILEWKWGTWHADNSDHQIIKRQLITRDALKDFMQRAQETAGFVNQEHLVEFVERHDLGWAKDSHALQYIFQADYSYYEKAAMVYALLIEQQLVI